MGHLLDTLTFPLHGVRLIEASAGTGKTYTIAALYLRLVLGHGGENAFSRPLSPPEILVVTFTNAATEELRDRIRLRLTEAAAFFRGNGDGDAFLKSLRDDYEAKRWPSCARMLEQAAQWMDESAIHTIHAWCRQMICRHAFDSGDFFDLELAPSDRKLYEDAACDYWRTHFYPQPVEVLSEITARCDTPQKLMEKVQPLLKERLSPPDDPFVLISRRRQAIEEARRIWDADFDAAVEKVRQAQADKVLNGNKYRADSLIKWQKSLCSWVRGSGPLPEARILEKFSSSGLQAGISRNKTVPEHPAYEALDRLNRTLGAIDIDTALYAHAAWDIGCRVRREKERLARMGFDDLLDRLHGALCGQSNGRLARVIREQFPAVLIDEFQDTDPVQYAIFSKVYLNQGAEDRRQGAGKRADTALPHSDAALLMIGDPKQAIYAFRGADIYTYLLARKDAQGAPFTLGTNFRSTETLVEAVNRVFGVGAGNPEGAFLFRDRIPFAAVAAEGRKDRFTVQGLPVPAMTFWHLNQAGTLNKTGEDGYVNRMAESAAGEIVRLLNLAQTQPSQAGFEAKDGAFKALRPADIAVLVRNRSEAGAIRQALNQRQVKSVYLSDKDSVFDSPEAKNLIYLLHACAEPERESFLRAALAIDVLALSFERLDRLVQDESAWEAESERFRNYRSLWRHQGVLPMLHALLRDFGVPSRLLTEPGGERTLTNLLHLAELLQSAASERDGEQALIRWLAEQVAQPGADVDEQILRLESDEELLRVVTIHKSKGLEYPLVFLPFISSFRRVTAGNSPMVKIHDDEGRALAVLNPSDEDLAAADRERLAEDLRMLYVALTRAQYVCWLGIGVVGKTSSLHLSALGYLLTGGEALPAERLSEKLSLLKGDCGHITIDLLPEPCVTLYRSRSEGVELTPAMTFSGKISCGWGVSSYSGMLAGARMAETDLPVTAASRLPYSAREDQLLEAEAETRSAPELPDSSGRSIRGFPRGPESGTFLHDILEWAAREGFGSLACHRPRIQKKIADLCGRRGWKDWSEILTDWLHKLLLTRFTLPDASRDMTLAGLPMEDYQPELEFLFAAHGVDIRELDEAVTAAVLPASPRPSLREQAVNGMLKGYMDLVFRFQDRYYVLDYKSNHLGDTQNAYTEKAMTAAMLEHRYDLQYVLYSLALHRLLKARLPGYDYRLHVGGALYLFLRGASDGGRGVYLDKPPQSLIEELDRVFAGKEASHDAG